MISFQFGDAKYSSTNIKSKQHEETKRFIDVEEGLKTTQKITNNQKKLKDALNSKKMTEFKKLLTSSEVDLNYVYSGSGNKTCLDIACSEPGMSEYVELLLDKGADINKFNSNHFKAPIHFAAETGDVETVKMMVGKGNLKINVLSEDNTALLLAIKKIKQNDTNKNYEDVVKFLVEAGTNVNLPDISGMTPILIAAERGLKNVIESILELSMSEVDLDSYKADNGKTAREILEEKLPVYIKEDWLKNVALNPKVDLYTKIRLHISAGREDDIVSDLENIENDELNKAMAENNTSITLIQRACKAGFDKAVDAFLEKGVLPNITSSVDKMKPVDYACRGGYHKILNSLKDKGVLDKDPDSGMSPLQFAIIGEKKAGDNSNVDYKECIKTILEYGKSNINYRDARGNTAIYYAIKKSDQDVVKNLLEKGAYLGVKNKNGMLPLADISPKTLNSYLNSCVNINDASPDSDDYEIQFDYSFFKLPTKDVNKKTAMASDTKAPLNVSKPTNEIDENSVDFSSIKADDQDSTMSEIQVLLYMSEHPELKDLLKHPIITSFLYIKWTKISLLFFSNLLCYVVFCISLISFILFYPQKNILSLVLTLFGVVFLIIREIIQIIIIKKKYWVSVENWLELILIFTCCILLFTNYCLKQFSAIAILLSLTELLLLIGKHPSFSTNIIMLKTVSWTFFKFLIWYCMLIIAFALSFHTLFKTDELDPMKTSDTKDEKNLFLYPGMSLFKTMIMTTGELEASEIDFNQSTLNYLIFIIFVFMIPIVLINLLNGLAVSDTQTIRNNAELHNIISQINFILNFKYVSQSLSVLCKICNRLLQHSPLKQLTDWIVSPIWLVLCTICYWLLHHLRLQLLINMIVPSPKLEPYFKLSIKVNQQSKVYVPNSKTIQTDSNRVSKEAKCFPKSYFHFKMDHQIINSAEDVIRYKANDNENNIDGLHIKLELLTKEVRNLTEKINND